MYLLVFSIFVAYYRFNLLGLLVIADLIFLNKML